MPSLLAHHFLKEHYSLCLVDHQFFLLSLEYQGRVDCRLYRLFVLTKRLSNDYFHFYFRLLMLGVCRIIKPSGPLDGLLGGRFLTAFAACLFTFIAKGVLIGFICILPEEFLIVNEKITLVFSVTLLPLLMALLSTIGFTRNSFKIIIFKPELIIMPTGN